MTFFILFLAISSIFHSTSATSTADIEAKQLKRSTFGFPNETKWDCFYLTTTPVQGLDEAIWRHDEFGNLLMAGLSYCKGCLCYNFDHRYPISEIPDGEISPFIINKMKSVDNCQAMSVRVNSLKGSARESEINGVIGRFGCDRSTMNLFTENDYEGALKMQRMLIDDARFEEIQKAFRAFKNKENSRVPKRNFKSAQDRFRERRNAATVLAEEVQTLLGRK